MKYTTTKTPTVGLICTSFHNTAGGLERQIIRTCESFISSGYKVILFSYDNYDAIPFFNIPESVEWVKCGNGLKPHDSASPINRLKQVYFLRKNLKSNSLTHLITFHHGLFPRTFLASLFLNIFLVVSERNSLSFYKYIRLSKLNIGFLSLYFANRITVQLPAYIKDYPFLLQKRIVVIPNFIRPPLLKYKEPRFYQKNISMIGRLCNQKNFQPLLDQTYKFNGDSNEYRIKIAGDGDLKQYFEKRYKDLILNGQLSLLGNIQDIDSFLFDSSIFCFPSLWEGYPNALVEALRIGLPIVTSLRMKELTQFVEHNINGLIVPDEDLLQALIYLLRRPKLLKSMSKNSFYKYELLHKEKPNLIWNQVVSNS